MPSRARWRCPPASPSPAPPAPTERVETVLQDDAALLYRDPARVRRALRRMSALGVDRVRITASWRRLAPARDSRRRPSFDATDAGAYDRRTLARLDRAVRGARAEGMTVMLDLGFFAPRWAVQRAGRGGRNVWRPSVREYRLYARAMARRYSGQVHLWTTWNEPNHARVPAAAVGAVGARLAGGHPPPVPAPARRGLRRGQGRVGAQPRAGGRPVLVRVSGPRARHATWGRCASPASWPAWTRACGR